MSRLLLVWMKLLITALILESLQPQVFMLELLLVELVILKFTGVKTTTGESAGAIGVYTIGVANTATGVGTVTGADKTSGVGATV